ncbi:Aldo-ket-red domain-containing protein [Mycena kentingensis (nom. inval.)]|nr:Aldo-ket-red domain-containing protein [Mycena kentingensis (nom. inval.)]
MVFGRRRSASRPLACKGGQPYNKTLTEDPYPTWKKLEELVAKGKRVHRLQNLLSHLLKIKPAVHQVEISYWVPQLEMLQWSREHNILLEAYSPLGGESKIGDTLTILEVVEIASALRMTPAQVVISWSVQRGAVFLPKSVTPERIVENLQVRALPRDVYMFDKLENAAASHKPYPRLNPSKGWRLDFDIFDENYAAI